MKESMLIRVVHLAFFSRLRALVHVRRSLTAQLLQLPATVCSANKPSNKAANLWVSLANCSHFSVDRRCYLKSAASSSLRERVCFLVGKISKSKGSRISHSRSVKLLEYSIVTQLEVCYDLTSSRSKISNGFYTIFRLNTT